MQRLKVLEFDLATLRRSVGGGSYVRGEQYARLGAVLRAAWDPDDCALRGTVRGNGDVYTTAAFFSETGEAVASFSRGECSCPVGFNCKHVVALILSSLAPGSPGAVEPAVPAPSPRPYRRATPRRP